MSSLVEVLRALDRTLNRVESPLSSVWAPGASAQAFGQAAAAGLVLPEPVVAWFTWHDGQGGRDVELVPDGIPISLGEALELRAQQLAVADHLGPEAPTGWQSSWLPLLVDWNRTAFWVVDCDDPAAPVLLRDTEEPDATPAFGSLAAMAVTVTAAYEEGALTTGPEGTVVEDRASFAALRQQHDGRPSALSSEQVRLLEALHSTDTDEVVTALNTLEGQLEPTMGAALVSAATDAPMYFARREAVLFLSRLGDPAAVATLAHVLSSDPSADVRQMAAVRAGQHLSDVLRTAVLAALDDPEPVVRSAAIVSLEDFARKGHPELLDAIRAHVDDPAPLVRRVVNQTLSRLQP